MRHVRLKPDIAFDKSAREALIAAAYRDASLGLIIAECAMGTS
jgi:hypothetical protein